MGRSPLVFGNGGDEGVLVGMLLRFTLRVTVVWSGAALPAIGVLGILPEDTDGAGGAPRSLLELFNSLSFFLIEKSRNLSLP